MTAQTEARAIDALAAEMRAGLEGTTNAPWSVDNHIQKPGDIGESWAVFETFEDDPPIITCYEWQQEANARHIARCHPDNIRALLDHVAALQTQVERLTEAAERVLKPAPGVRKPEPWVYGILGSALKKEEGR